MKDWILFCGLFACLFVMPTREARATDQVIRCDNCASPVSVARSTGTGGTKIIADYSKKTLTAFSVEYDYELHIWRTLPASIPSGIVQSFNNDLSPAMVSSGATITVRAGQPGHLIGPGSAYRDANAYDIIGSATFRSGLEREIAQNYAAANSGNTAWNDLAFSLKGLTIGFLSKYGIQNITIRIMWSDGSRTVLKIDSDRVYQAEYQPGDSADPRGNKIPDSAVTTGPSGYVGHYDFNGNNDLQDWINAAGQYGVPVINVNNGRTGVSCVMDGVKLKCTYTKIF